MASVILPYSEFRLKSAFKPGIELTAEDVAEMQRRVVAENKKWKQRKRRQESTGEVMDESQIKRSKAQAERHRRKKDWTRRELSASDKLRLSMAWSAE